MLQVCASLLCKPLEIIFKWCLESGIFPLEWKKSNVVTDHKKWQTISSKLLANPTSSDMWKNIWTCVYKEMFDSFTTNHHISTNHSSFKPEDSCISQLLLVTHGIYASFNEKYEVWGVFLDMSKPFYKAWHESLISKLKQRKMEYLANCCVS